MRSTAMLALMAAMLECSARAPEKDPPALVAPPGFAVATYATVPDARFMVLASDGSVYVSATYAGRIVRLVDNGHGVADSVQDVASGLDLPHGMAFHKGAFYVATHDGVVRFGLD